MEAPHRLIAATLTLIEAEGEQGFSTRAACDLAGVKAPTLYHHFGTADGLLSAAVEIAFGQFLARKHALSVEDDPGAALRAGWDDYVGFAAERPRLYAAMIARVLQGSKIAAAVEGRAMLVRKVERLRAHDRLLLDVQAAADLIWASAHAAAMLWVASPASSPSMAVVRVLRDTALVLVDRQAVTTGEDA